MPRGLSESFIKDLIKGKLSKLLNSIKIDQTLSLDIRENYINIYYRGGNLLKISTSNDDIYQPEFNRGYLNGIDDNLNLPNINNNADADKLITQIPSLKNYMDIYFGKCNRGNEKEFQQLLARENNIDLAKGSDYFICDIEYANTENNSRFDMIAVKWESSGHQRKSGENLLLAFIEVKYGDIALKNQSGIIKHCNDLENFLNNSDTINNIKNEMKTVFNQKLKLGLVNNKNEIKSFSNEKPEFIFIIINHDPESTTLKDEIDKLEKYNNYNLKFATSNFMGYGLFKENIYDLDDFKNTFPKQIYCKNQENICI